MDELDKYISGIIALNDIEKGLCKKLPVYESWSKLAYQVIDYELGRGNVEIAYDLLNKMKGGPELEGTYDWYEKLFSYNNEKLIKYEIQNRISDKNYILNLLGFATGVNRTNIVVKILYELGYNLENLIVPIFDDQYYQHYFDVISEIINYTRLDVIKRESKNNDRIRIWYDNATLNQI